MSEIALPSNSCIGSLVARPMFIYTTSSVSDGGRRLRSYHLTTRITVLTSKKVNLFCNAETKILKHHLSICQPNLEIYFRKNFSEFDLTYTCPLRLVPDTIILNVTLSREFTNKLGKNSEESTYCCLTTAYTFILIVMKQAIQRRKSVWAKVKDKP